MPASRRLNFKHLRYFLEIAQRGSVTAAAKALNVAPQTVSAQLLELEAATGQSLFERTGRGLTLTAAGQIAQDYATTIFAMGEELADVLTAGAQPHRQSLRIGVTDSVPKLLAVAVLEPVLKKHRERVELICREGPLAELAGLASARELDAVLADAPMSPTLAGSLQARLLMTSGLSFMAAKTLARSLPRHFPGCLDNAPLLAGSSATSPLAQALDTWLMEKNIQVRIAGRFEDTALMKDFAEKGFGVIAVPTSIERQVARQFDLVVLGRTTDVKHSVFLMRPRRHRAHALVTDIEQQFAGQTSRV
jgi:LysR family transcriptional activator of nhaA